MPDFPPLGTYENEVSMPASVFGRPNTNPPAIVDQDNVALLEFTLNTDRAFYLFELPPDYAGGGLGIHIEWTNDGGVDDNGLAAKWQLDYQTAAEGDSVAGSHANSPKTVEDIYASASGWIEMETPDMVIAEADFIGKHHIFLKVSAVTPAGAPLTCKPHMVCMCVHYTANIAPE